MTKKSTKRSTAKTKAENAIAGAAIIGAREGQEDAWKIGTTSVEGCEEPVHVLILADGMGGHVGGAKASNTAVDCAMSLMQSSKLPINERLSEALGAANVALADEIRADTSLKGMGCTLIITALQPGGVIDWISVGDSPMLEVGRRVRRLNANHSLAEKIDREAAEGKRSWEEAKNDPERHVLLSALTGKAPRLVDQGSIKLEDNTALLLASDGIESLTGREIHEIVLDASSPKDTVETLLGAVKKKNVPDQDNTSLVCVFNGKPMGAPAPAPAKKAGGLGWLSALFLLIGIIAIAGGAAALLFLQFETVEETQDTPVPVEASPDEDAQTTPDRGPSVPQNDTQRRLIDSQEFQTANERASTVQEKEDKRRTTPSNAQTSPSGAQQQEPSGASNGAPATQSTEQSQDEASAQNSATDAGEAAEKAETVAQAAEQAASEENPSEQAVTPDGGGEDSGSDDGGALPSS